MANKQCSSCGVLKPLTAYAKASTCKDGHRSYCKVCHKLRKDAWRRANAAHHSLKCAEWRRANPDKVKDIQKKADAKRRNSGAAAESARRRRAANPDRYRAEVSARRKKLRNATPPWVNIASIREIYLLAKKKGLTVDHIIPIQHPLVCGLHVPANLQLLPLSENVRKQNMFMGIVGRGCRKKK